MVSSLSAGILFGWGLSLNILNVGTFGTHVNGSALVGLHV